ncbi:MAG: endonuclease/exonuclease/phosphatase family protein [Bacteroidaceae bacterium]|nr:endonuclease/exonuclease/phosphatase family protein [Bacteroidaceae bacterium]
MKKILITIAITLAFGTLCSGNPVEKRYGLYGVAFYNLENLFDTLHDAGKNDYEFLPDGANHWGTMKYRAKLKNMSKVLSQLCTDKLKNGPAVIGVSEVENRRVLDDLVKEPALAARGYQVVHVDGPDRRGVDCAFLYNPKYFQKESHMLVPFYYLDEKQPDVDLGFYVDDNKKVVPYQELRGDTAYITRGFLVMSGTMAGERMHFIVVHWPSRAAGSFARERAAYQVYHLKEALLQQDPGSKVIIMGDMNDDPKNKSMVNELKCKHKPEQTGPTELYNPWWNTLYKTGQGSLLYDGKWNLFDQIVFTGNLLGNDRSTLKYLRNEVFVRDFLFQQSGKNRGEPHRTHASGVWLNGYSDHLPTIVYLVKEIK